MMDNAITHSKAFLGYKEAFTSKTFDAFIKDASGNIDKNLVKFDGNDKQYKSIKSEFKDNDMMDDYLKLYTKTNNLKNEFGSKFKNDKADEDLKQLDIYNRSMNDLTLQHDSLHIKLVLWVSFTIIIMVIGIKAVK